MLFSTRTWPSSGLSVCMTMRKMVVLPAPLGPTRPTFSPRNTVAEASTNSSCLPCCFEMASMWITGAETT